MLLTVATNNKQTKVVPVTGFSKEQLHEIHHSPTHDLMSTFRSCSSNDVRQCLAPKSRKASLFFFFPSSCFPGASSQPGPHTLLSQDFQLPLSQQRAGKEVIEGWTCQKWRSPRVWAALSRDLEPSVLSPLFIPSTASFSPSCPHSHLTPGIQEIKKLPGWMQLSGKKHGINTSQP